MRIRRRIYVIKRKATLWTFAALAVVGLLAFVGYRLFAPAYESLMFRPSSDYLSRTQGQIEPHFPNAIQSIKLLRVDRGIAAAFFTIELTQDDIDAFLVKPVEPGYVVEKSPPDEPTEITIYSGSRSDTSYFLYLEKLSDHKWYGADRWTPNEEAFWKRFEENRYLSE